MRPDEQVGQPCQCGQGVIVRQWYGCAECNAMIPIGRQRETVGQREYYPVTVSKGEVRAFLEQPLLYSGNGLAER